MFLKFGVLFLCLLADIALGVYTYMHFDSLLTRFLFFVFTAAVVAMIVIKLANPDISKDVEDNIPSSVTGKNMDENS